MNCPDDNVVVDFVGGRLEPIKRRQFELHLDTCDSCRQLVAASALADSQTNGDLPPRNPFHSQEFDRGASIGRYRIIDRVGAGAMGLVYAAEDSLLGRSVALKVVRNTHGDSDSQKRARLLREARVSCSIQHPNVVRVHDVFELDDGSPVLVMDLLTGQTLRARLDAVKRLSLKEAKQLFEPVLDALACAHQLGIVHRDLKPENIFICTEPAQNEQVRIVDFGIAKLTAHPEQHGEANLTDTGAIVGTPYYMSPEQAFGEKDIDGRADLWAVGIMLYECLSGVRPTEGQNVGQVLKRIVHYSFPPILDTMPDCPREIEALLGSLLCAREARLASARDVQERLAQATKAPTSKLAPLIRWRMKNLALWRGIIGMSLLAGAGIGLVVRSYSSTALTAESSESPATPPPSLEDPSLVQPTASSLPSTETLPSATLERRVPRPLSHPSGTPSRRPESRQRETDPKHLLMDPPF